MEPGLKIFTIFLKVVMKLNIRVEASFFYDALFSRITGFVSGSKMLCGR
jgi:hypothetical protein